MRKILAAIVSLLMATSLLTLVTPVQAYIPTHSWIAPFYRDHDPFYGTSVTAYKTGSTAQLLVGVNNDWSGYPNITVTAVKVWFDWNENYTSIETPYVMELGAYHNFMINFRVPDTDVASNIMPHSYRIYVEFSYDSNEDYWTYYYGTGFAVYSEDQADAQELYHELQAFRYTYPVFISSEARSSWLKAQIEYRTGESDYRNGDFTGAKTHYQTSWNLYNQSVDSEAEVGKAIEDALTNLMNSFVETSKMQAQGFLILSVGIFVGMILIGIGVIIYALAKRKIASTSATTAS